MSTLPNYHVIVTGSRPEKIGNSNRFQPMPEVNVEFIERTLAKLASSQYVALYHGMAAGVDKVVDDYAHTNGIHVRQFPAYWFDPTKPDNVDKRAGLFRNEAMVRQALTNVHGKTNEHVVLLAFYNTPTLAESTGTAHCHDFALAQNKKPKNADKQISVQSFQLPILKGQDSLVSTTLTTENLIPPF